MGRGTRAADRGAGHLSSSPLFAARQVEVVRQSVARIAFARITPSSVGPRPFLPACCRVELSVRTPWQSLRGSGSAEPPGTFRPGVQPVGI
jgi:hypothetical protein